MKMNDYHNMAYASSQEMELQANKRIIVLTFKSQQVFNKLNIQSEDLKCNYFANTLLMDFI